MSNELVELEPWIAFTENSLQGVVVGMLKSKVDANHWPLENTFFEINGRSIRAKNVILHIAPGSTLTNPQDSRNEDLERIKSVVIAVEFEPVNTFRIGSRSNS